MIMLFSLYSFHPDHLAPELMTCMDITDEQVIRQVSDNQPLPDPAMSSIQAS
jgi:hypothetical protein